ncbi:MAG: pyridoxamine 5'-phosphate oxidase family protein [Candidatus Tectomicrobia bacterium]|nr:pyridoxamine 5'-phosphate oxidase family protein [Candidatus Tectomicrobia bacterium]
MAGHSLSSPFVQRFLASKSVAVLATLQASGAPLAMPMWFVHDDSAIVMISEVGLRKVRNLRRDPRVCVVAEGEREGVVAGVIVQGHARFLETETERTSYVGALHAKYSGLAERWGGRAMPPDRVMFRIDPDRISTWGLGD